jgi:hypothetical protein
VRLTYCYDSTVSLLPLHPHAWTSKKPSTIIKTENVLPETMTVKEIVGALVARTTNFLR